MTQPLIQLDHHATTPCDPRVVEAMAPYWTELAANASSISHRAGLRAKEAVEQARQTIADCLRCTPREIVFTSGA
ncbi:MAG: aminotransferase class V-fold PLP-dependent enzyme, partial [Planctomycetaceae bacterium]|nr:aminotransferase class V-fold PLP-dependent enzyme [Planctomycetaceae bacterium]